MAQQTKADRSAAGKKAAATRERNEQRAEAQSAGREAAATRQGHAAEQAVTQARRAVGTMFGAGKSAAKLAGTAAKQAGKAARTRAGA